MIQEYNNHNHVCTCIGIKHYVLHSTLAIRKMRRKKCIVYTCSFKKKWFWIVRQTELF